MKTFTRCRTNRLQQWSSMRSWLPLIATVCIAVVTTLGHSVSNSFSSVDSLL